MTEYSWAEEFSRATALFAGETPGPIVEQAILDIFEQHPQLVVKAIDQVGASFAAGKIRSGWAVLRTHVETHATPARNATASDSSARTKKISQAEQWLRTCGIHFDRESEVQDEIFFSRGLLHAWADDIALRGRMLTLWRELRPRGEQLEQEANERAAAWIASHTCERCGNVHPFAGGCTCTKRAEETRELLERNGITPDEPTLEQPEPTLA